MGAGLVTWAAPAGDAALFMAQSALPMINGRLLAGDPRVFWVLADGTTRDVDVKFPAGLVASTGAWALEAPCLFAQAPASTEPAAFVNIDPTSSAQGRRVVLSDCRQYVLAIAADDHDIWVAHGSAIERVTPSTGAATTFDAPGPVVAMARTPGSLWVSAAGGSEGPTLLRLDPTSGSILGRIPLDAHRLTAGLGGVWAIMRSGDPSCGESLRNLDVPCAAPGPLVRVDEAMTVTPGPTVVAPSRGGEATQGVVLAAAHDNDLWVVSQHDWSLIPEPGSRAPRVTVIASTLQLERRDAGTGAVLGVHEIDSWTAKDGPNTPHPWGRADALVPLADGRLLLAMSGSESFEIRTISP